MRIKNSVGEEFVMKFQGAVKGFTGIAEQMIQRFLYFYCHYTPYIITIKLLWPIIYTTLKRAKNNSMCQIRHNDTTPKIKMQKMRQPVIHYFRRRTRRGRTRTHRCQFPWVQFAPGFHTAQLCRYPRHRFPTSNLLKLTLCYITSYVSEKRENSWTKCRSLN